MSELTTRSRGTIKQITPDELIGYLNAVSSGTKKGTFYNMSDEQIGALNDKISKMVSTFRPFAALMALSPSTTHDARIATAMQLMSSKASVQDNDARKWETTIIRESLDLMPVTKVFDLFQYLIGYRREQNGKKRVLRKSKKAIGGSFVKGMIKEYLRRNARRLSLWSVKYPKDFRRVARHIHLSPSEFKGVGYVFTTEDKHPAAGRTPFQEKAEKVKESPADIIPTELWELPYENARGFALGKFGISKEDFEKKFSELGRKTIKEQMTSAKRTQEAGGVSTFDPAKARSLFELFVYLGGQESIPAKAAEWVDKVAKKEASRIGLNIKNAAVIVDTSLSMFGTKATKRHPLYKAMAIARIIEKSSDSCKIFYTTPQSDNVVIPKLHGSTSYAQSVIDALKDGCEQIFLVGDGYENAPEGLTHRVLYAFKKKIDVDDKISFLHLNPVQAAESLGGVREMSSYAPSAGISNVQGISASIFIALAKTYPLKALETYFSELVRLQSEETKALMPADYQKLLPSAQ